MTNELRARVLALLKRIEWEGWEPGSDTLDACPLCNSLRTEGHADGCELTAIIQELERHALADQAQASQERMLQSALHCAFTPTPPPRSCCEYHRRIDTGDTFQPGEGVVWCGRGFDDA